MKKQTKIRVINSFIGTHCWKAAPSTVEFLRYPHRHQFSVHTEIDVTHNDREIEFFLLQRDIDLIIAKCFGSEQTKQLGTTSCEQIAEAIHQDLIKIEQYRNRLIKISIFEDNENGAIVSFDHSTQE